MNFRLSAQWRSTHYAKCLRRACVFFSYSRAKLSTTLHQETNKTPTSLSHQRPTAKLSPSDSKATPTTALQYSANRVTVYNNVPRHFRVVSSQFSAGQTEKNALPKVGQGLFFFWSYSGHSPHSLLELIFYYSMQMNFGNL